MARLIPKSPYLLTAGLLTTIFVLVQPGAALAEWPVFRGDSAGSAPPTAASEDTDHLRVKWETPIPGAGHSTPVFSDGILYVTTARKSADTYGLVNGGLWLCAAAASCMMLLFLRTTILSDAFYPGTVYWQGLFFLVLLLLALFGINVLGCQRDSIRQWVYFTVMTTVNLVCVWILVDKNRRNGWILLTMGALASGLCLYLFPFWWGWSRKPSIQPFIIALSLMPLGVTVPFLLPEATTVWGKVRSWALECLPAAAVIGYLFYRAGQDQISSFWDIQPVHEMALPRWYLPAASIVLGAAGAAMVMAIRFRIALRIAMVLVGLVTLAGVGMLLPMAINQYKYLQYQLVRGESGRPLGWAGYAVIPALIVAGTGATLAARRWRTPDKSYKPGLGVALTVSLLCVVGMWAGSGATSGLTGSIVAVHAQEGRILWVSGGAPIDTRVANGFNSDATPSPAVHDELVGGYFGTNGIFACHRHTGKVMWTYYDIPCKSMYGSASSLLVVGGQHPCFIIQSDSDEPPSQVLALSYVNGRPVWRDTRPAVAAWRSPISCRYESDTVVCVWGAAHADFYDAKTGKRLHRVKDIKLGQGDPVSSPVYYDGVVYLAGSDWLVGISLREVLRRGEGESRFHTGKDTDPNDKTPTLGSTIRLSMNEDGPTCSTPACSQGRLVSVSDGGIVMCIDLVNKRILWKRKFEAVYASPLIVGRHAYVVTTKGAVYAFDITGDSYRETGKLALNENVSASPIAFEDRIFIRTIKRLVCLQVGVETRPNAKRIPKQGRYRAPDSPLWPNRMTEPVLAALRIAYPGIADFPRAPQTERTELPPESLPQVKR